MYPSGDYSTSADSEPSLRDRQLLHFIDRWSFKVCGTHVPRRSFSPTHLLAARAANFCDWTVAQRMFHVKHFATATTPLTGMDRDSLMFIANYKNPRGGGNRLTDGAALGTVMFHVKHRYLTMSQKPC